MYVYPITIRFILRFPVFFFTYHMFSTTITRPTVFLITDICLSFQYHTILIKTETLIQYKTSTYALAYHLNVSTHIYKLDSKQLNSIKRVLNRNETIKYFANENCAPPSNRFAKTSSPLTKTRKIVMTLPQLTSATSRE